MFTFGVAGLISAYILIAILLLAVNLYSSWSWQIKAGLIIIVSAFYIVSYFSFPPLLGWPTKADLPEQFSLIAAQVNEPDKTSGEEGVIHLWVMELTAGVAKPRAYRVPFTPDLHAKVVAATGKLGQGIQQLGEVVKKENKSSKQLESQTKEGRPSAKIEFNDLPAPLFPEK